MTFQIKETVWSGNRPTIGYVAQFEEDKMTFHAISSPTHVEAILKSILDLFAKIKSMAPSSQSIIVSNEIIASTYYLKKKKKKKQWNYWRNLKYTKTYCWKRNTSANCQ